MAKYSKAAQKSVEDAMNEMKAGKLTTGTGAKVKNPRQAIAIGLSEAREKGAKVPPVKAGKKATGKAQVPKKAAPLKKAPAGKKSTSKSK